MNKQTGKEKEKSKEKGKMEIEKKEERFEELDDNLIPLPIMRKDKFKVDGILPLPLTSNKLPNRYPIVKSKEPVERIENYEGLLKPTPIEIELRGQLPPFDVEKELNFDVPKLIPTKKELEKENYKLIDYISDRDYFRKHIPNRQN